MIQEQSDKFWIEEYPRKNFDEKIKYWSANFHQQMRWNGESGLDEMAVFSKDSFESWKMKEPEIDKMFPLIIEKIGLNKEKVYEALRK